MSKYIERIEVEKLFGHYNYEIKKKDLFSEEPLIIIYGDNGSGKTTILELLFYVLSTLDNSGHKSKVANIKFQKFTVFLQGGLEITVERASEQLIGSFNFYVKEKGEVVHSVFLKADSENEIRVGLDGDEESAKEFILIINYIAELKIDIHYLSDKRKLVEGFYRPKDRDSKSDEDYVTLGGARRILSRYTNRFEESEEANDLETSVQNLESWIRSHVLQGSKTGDQNTNSIYTDLIRRVATSSNSDSEIENVDNLVNKLAEIRVESDSYYRYGLVSKIETKEIENIFMNSPKRGQSLIHSILAPYVEGLQARLDSLKEIQTIIDFFVNSMNSYFNSKSIEYHLGEGFHIFVDESHEKLELNMLSSGEKQLLLLFCHVITASDNASILIIDEPEISLNIKWQRTLIDTLLEFSKHKNVQLVFASHSIELLTGHSGSVCKLQHKSSL